MAINYPGTLPALKYDYSSCVTIAQDSCSVEKVVRQVYYKGTTYKLDFFVDHSKDDLFYLNQNIISYQEPSGVFDESIIKLKPIINNFTLDNQLGFLLSICQQLKYIDDRETGVGEKYLSPEATIASKSSDCEDRSVLFAYLVYKLLDLDTVVLYYPTKEHMNVGVKLPEQKWIPESGETVLIKEELFLICEPSGLWLSPGQQLDVINRTDEYEVFEIVRF